MILLGFALLAFLMGCAAAFPIAVAAVRQEREDADRRFCEEHASTAWLLGKREGAHNVNRALEAHVRPRRGCKLCEEVGPHEAIH